MFTKKKLEKAISETKTRSAWTRGVKEYASELLDNIHDDSDICNERLLQKALLYGASDWIEYSDGGCSLIYNCDIAKRLCTASEYRRKREGMLNPNSRELWLDVQARALFQAWVLIRNAYRKIKEEG